MKNSSSHIKKSYRVIGMLFKCLSILMMSSALAMDVKQDNLNSQLVEAAILGNMQQVKQLIAKGADVNARNRSGDIALIRAAEDGYTEICKLLISKGANVNAYDYYGFTALIQAAANGHKEI